MLGNQTINKCGAVNNDGECDEGSSNCGQCGTASWERTSDSLYRSVALQSYTKRGEGSGARLGRGLPTMFVTTGILHLVGWYSAQCTVLLTSKSVINWITQAS